MLSEMSLLTKSLKSVPTGKWFTVINKAGEDMTDIIKQLIDSHEQFEFSDDYKKFKRLDDIFLWEQPQPKN